MDPSAPDASTDRALVTAARTLAMAGPGAGGPRLLAQLCDPGLGAEAVLAVLRLEPWLAARVLKLANAPFYGQGGQVGSLERALQLLGTLAVRSIGAAACLDLKALPAAGPAFDPVRFRQHSLASALAAQQLASALAPQRLGEAFIAGLLRHFGVPLMACAWPVAMADWQPPAAAAPEAVLAAERRQFGVDHLAAFARLVSAWSLPAWLPAAAVAPPAGAAPLASAAADPLPAVLAWADAAASQAGYPLWPNALPADGPVPAGLDPAQWQALVAQLPGQVLAMAGA